MPRNLTFVNLPHSEIRPKNWSLKSPLQEKPGHITDCDRFLHAVFPDLQADREVLLLATSRFKSGPKEAGGGVKWRRNPFTEAKLPLIGRMRQPAYTSISSFNWLRATEDRWFQANLGTADRAHALMLDDIGTAVDPDLVAKHCGPASAVIESSEGNYQHVFRFAEPIDFPSAHMALARIYNSVTEAKLTDAGGGNAIRLIRLPGSYNGKPKNGTWRSRLVHCDTDAGVIPGDAEALCDMWRIPLVEVKAARIGGGGMRPVGKPVPPDAWVIDPDPVVRALRKQGLMSVNAEPHGSAGFIEMVCPWCDRHTDGADTAGFVPVRLLGTHMRHGFRCFHTHCKKRTVEDLAKFLGVSERELIPFRKKVSGMRARAKARMLRELAEEMA